MEEKEKRKQSTTQNIFGDWIKSIPVGDYNRIRHQVINDCKITNQIFRHWKCGNSQVPVLAHEKINLIAGKVIFKPDKNGQSNSTP